jgi:hypothetical protein
LYVLPGLEAKMWLSLPDLSLPKRSAAHFGSVGCLDWRHTPTADYLFVFRRASSSLSYDDQRFHGDGNETAMIASSAPELSQLETFQKANALCHPGNGNSATHLKSFADFHYRAKAFQ